VFFTWYGLSLTVTWFSSKKLAKQEAALELLKTVFPAEYELYYGNRDLFTTGTATSSSSNNAKLGGAESVLRQKFLSQATLLDQPERLMAGNVAFYSKTAFAHVLHEFNVVPSSTFAALLLRDQHRAGNGGEQEFTVVALASGSWLVGFWDQFLSGFGSLSGFYTVFQLYLINVFKCQFTCLNFILVFMPGCKVLGVKCILFYFFALLI